MEQTRGGHVKSVGPQVTKCQMYLTILRYLRASCDLQSIGAIKCTQEMMSLTSL